MTNHEPARDSITIAGKTFSVVVPYAEGHKLTAGEASALNQTFAENIRNNFAKRVKDAGADADLEVLQSELDQYMDDYEFGVRTGGGRTADPVMSEAMDIMRDKVRASLKKKGISLKDVAFGEFTGAKAITARAKAEFDKGSEAAKQVLALAKQRVEAAKEVADVELDAA